jgi:hypothetical protein
MNSYYCGPLYGTHQIDVSKSPNSAQKVETTTIGIVFYFSLM